MCALLTDKIGFWLVESKKDRKNKYFKTHFISIVIIEIQPGLS